MNIQTITMAPADAVKKLAAYKKQLRKRTDSEYLAATQAYTALAKGTPLVDLTNVFADAPTDQKGRPRLAIARADRKQVRFEANGSQFIFDAHKNPSSWATWSEGLRMSFGAGKVVGVRWHGNKTVAGVPRGYALVPMIPADVRPNVALNKAFILWEVERWEAKPIGARPDRDPFLLQYLGGDLYAIIAEWELTDVERSIMAGRAKE